MKRIIIYIILIITFTALGIIGYLNKFKNTPTQNKKENLDSSILNTNYYMFNTETGAYEEFKITEQEVSYKGSTLNIDNTCKTYEYESSTKLVKLNCNKSFKISTYNDEYLVINMDNQDYYFYEEIEKSYRKEFENTFKTTMSTYKQEGENELKEKEIAISELDGIINNRLTSFIYLKGTSCVDSCTIFNKAFLSLNLKNKNTYFLDTSKLTSSDLTKLNRKYEELPTTLSEYNKTYPQVLIVGNGSVYEKTRINIKGFNMTESIDYLKNWEVNHE